MCRISFLVVAIFIFMMFGSASAQTSIDGMITQGDLMVPAGSFFNAVGFQMILDDKTQTIRISRNNVIGALRLGYPQLIYAGRVYDLSRAPNLVNGNIYIPLRACAEAMGYQVKWDGTTKSAIVVGDSIKFSVKTTIQEMESSTIKAQASSAVKAKYYQQTYDGIEAQVLELVPPVHVQVVLGQDYVGGTEQLSSMAMRSGAEAAINGTFFEAYGGRPEPCNILIRDGRVIHGGDTGTTIGFTSDGRVKMTPLKVRVEGATNGSFKWPNNWYAYGFNHTPEGNGVYIYTQERGVKLGFADGTQVIVDGGKVVRKTKGENVNIPSQGYVINFTGEEQTLADRFQIGTSVKYRVIFENDGGLNWGDIVAAVGGGPRLVNQGRITVNPVAEGFTEDKIVEGSATRSAIGVKADGNIILLTVPEATIRELAVIMQKLGAVDAMNLDGGASSGLWFQGEYITEPARLLSNALIFK